MISQKIFNIALGVSLLAHSVFIWRMPFFKQFTFIPEKKIEVSYCFINKEKQFSVYKEKDSLNNARASQEKLVFPGTPREALNLKVEAASLEPKKLEPRVPVAQAVNLTNIQSEYRRNPTELNRYYFEIWEKVRHSAYQQLYNERSLSGEVRLVFAVSKGGQLIDMKVVEEGSVLDDIKKAGVSSVKNASPFAVFPKDLVKNEEFFDIVISFEPK